MSVFNACRSTSWVERSVATRAAKLDDKKTRKTENGDCFSEVEHKHGDPVASLDYAHVHKSIIYFITLFVTANVFGTVHLYLQDVFYKLFSCAWLFRHLFNYFFCLHVLHATLDSPRLDN